MTDNIHTIPTRKALHNQNLREIRESYERAKTSQSVVNQFMLALILKGTDYDIGDEAFQAIEDALNNRPKNVDYLDLRR